MSEKTKAVSEKKNRRISASQIETFTMCPRKWWFERILRLPGIPRDYFTFGTVLHACCERFLCATEKGRVPGPKEVPIVNGATPWPFNAVNLWWMDGPLKGQEFGEPVEVFPEGWETIEDRGTTASVTPNEAKLIRDKVEQAIERGILSRDNMLEVEREILVDVIPGVELVGFIDVFRPSEEDRFVEVHDHKTFSESGARFLKQPGPKDVGGNNIPVMAPYEKGDGSSPNSICHNQQVLTYAAATSILDDYDGPVLVRHNQFPKFNDPKGVRVIDGLVSATRIEQHWKWIQEQAAEIVKVGKIKRWDDTPPPTRDDACNAFGGCAFRKICTRIETPEVYESRVNRLVKQMEGQKPLNVPLTASSKAARKKRSKTKTEKPMSIFAEKKSKSKTAAAKKAAGSAQAKKSTKQAVGEAINDGPKGTKPEAVAGGPPWANPKCSACHGAGFNKSGAGCMICNKTAKKRNGITSMMYHIEQADDGRMAIAMEEHIETIEAAGAATEWEEGQEVDATEPEPAPVEEVEEAPEEEPEPAPVEEAPKKVSKPKSAPKAATKSKAGRPKKGLTILLRAHQLKGVGQEMVMAQQFLEEVGAEMAADMGQSDGYWALDTWKRRDRLRQAGEVLAERLARKTLVVPGVSDPDLDALVVALLPYADTVIEGGR